MRDRSADVGLVLMEQGSIPGDPSGPRQRPSSPSPTVLTKAGLSQEKTWREMGAGHCAPDIVLGRLRPREDCPADARTIGLKQRPSHLQITADRQDRASEAFGAVARELAVVDRELAEPEPSENVSMIDGLRGEKYCGRQN